MRTIVLAIGGNALSAPGAGAFAAQEAAARSVAEHAVDLLADDRRLVVVHGNGPQVGALALAQEAVARDVPPQPLFVLGAMTQGQIGFSLSAAIGDALVARGHRREVVTVVTQVVVDGNDPAFAAPTKPIGPFFPKGRAQRLAQIRGWSVAEDAGRGWRRVVPSPEPLEVVEWPQIRSLVEAGQVVIAGGGGGIPVTRGEAGALHGVDAVIDKDYTAARVGRLVGAETLLLLTGVARVSLGYGTPGAREVAEMTVAEARAHLAAGEFPAGSMGPKVDAACRFVEEGGTESIITSIDRGPDALAGITGTRIHA